MGVNYTLENHVLPAETNPIFTGSGTTVGSTIWPSATIAAWDSFIATATAVASGQAKNGAISQVATMGVAVVVAGLVVMTLT